MYGVILTVLLTTAPAQGSCPTCPPAGVSHAALPGQRVTAAPPLAAAGHAAPARCAHRPQLVRRVAARVLHPFRRR